MKNALRKNFTLIELLGVIAIIGILASVGFGTYSVAQNKARVSATRAVIQKIDQAIEMTRAKLGYVPATSGWQKLSVSNDNISFNDTRFDSAFRKNFNAEGLNIDGSDVVDSWGTEIYYCYPGISKKTRVDILSAGPDGKFGSGKTDTPPSAIGSYKTSGEWNCDDIANF